MCYYWRRESQVRVLRFPSERNWYGAALIEMQDFSEGASRSNKLVHGEYLKTSMLKK